MRTLPAPPRTPRPYSKNAQFNKLWLKHSAVFADPCGPTQNANWKFQMYFWSRSFRNIREISLPFEAELKIQSNPIMEKSFPHSQRNFHFSRNCAYLWTTVQPNDDDYNFHFKKIKSIRSSIISKSGPFEQIQTEIKTEQDYRFKLKIGPTSDFNVNRCMKRVTIWCYQTYMV